ncbi:MAG: molybdopterin biosynthesis protein [Candidatus Poseidoniales archaeon]|nr:MAG: molybdopterin biosynthesis protein [Candidatus Poseidoniales archaeon]
MRQQGHRHGRDYYLSDLPLDEALERFRALLDQSGIALTTAFETIPLIEARGRVTAAPVWAVASSPHYDASAMDGIAVRAKETIGATESSPLRLSSPDQVRWVDTGDPMPDGFDSVIMVEHVHELDDATIEIRAPVPPYHHVRPIGEDIVATELILPKNHVLRPVDLGACAAAGLTDVSVSRKPVVTIIPTGTELVPIGATLKPGDIVEFNSLIIGGLVDEWGGSSQTSPPVADDYEAIKTAVSNAAVDSDIVLVNAGSSAGSEDYTAEIVADLGELAVHGVAIRPGHPVVLGVVNGKPTLGIPGYPVSAALSCELFVKPLIEKALGLREVSRDIADATIARNVHSPLGEDEYLRVKLGRVRERMVATPIQRGAGVIMSLVRADGLVKIPRLSEGVEAGTQVTVNLLRPLEAIEHTIVATGSHDLVLDLIASELTGTGGVSFASSNVGSLGGLRAIDRGEAHLAGTHLLDEESGEYNVSFLRRYVRNQCVVLVNLVHRVQGFIIPKGNPASIESLNDLAREDIVFVNRQRGSGTRVLLDYKLVAAGIDTQQVAGYEREEYTHLAVAAAVAGGRANVGLGILSAARAIGMDFIPLFDERYDLAIPEDIYDSKLLAPMLQLIQSSDFRVKVEELGGYDAGQMGEVIARIAGPLK